MYANDVNIRICTYLCISVLYICIYVYHISMFMYIYTYIFGIHFELRFFDSI